MKLRTHAHAGLAAGLLALAACASGPEEVRDRPDPRDPRGLELLDVGAEPRRALRLGSGTDVEKREALLDVDGWMRQGPASGRLDTPAARFEITASVRDDDPLTLDVAIAAPQLVDVDQADPRTVQQMLEALEGAGGANGELRLDARGHVLAARLQPDDPRSRQLVDLLDALRQAVDPLSVLLPEEPVGVGARWRVTQRRDQARARGVEQVVEVSVAELDPSRVRLQVSATMAADEVDFTELPEGARGRVMRLRGEADGELVLEQGAVLPVEAHARSTWDVVSHVEMTPGQVDELTYQQVLELRVSRAP